MVNRFPRWRFALALLGLILMSEALVMVLFAVMPKLTPWVEVWLDVLLLSLFTGPLVWMLTRDIARREAVSECDRLRSRITTILDAAVDGIVVCDAEGRIVTFNNGGEAIFGYRAEEVIGQPVSILMPQRFAGGHAAHLDGFTHGAVRARPMDSRGVLVGRRKDGREIPVEVSIAKSESAGDLMLVAVVRDVSERYRVESELRLAKEEAEAGTRAKNEFLANMSHEFRTPMNAIIGLSALLRDTPLNPEQRDCLETIRANGDSLLAILSDILDFTKIEANTLALDPAPFDVRFCVKSAIDLLAPRAARKKLDLVYRVDDPVPATLGGDIVRLRQIIVNLVGNAIQFSESGKISLHMRQLGQIEGRTELQVDITDTGIGIPSDRMDRLFKAFSQVDASSTRRFGGVGLGLVISKRLVELMAGRIWVESKVGAGSTFSFTVLLEGPAAKRP